MVEFSVFFQGGSKDGCAAKCRVEEFKVGLPIQVDEEVYVIQPGPIAELIEKTQKDIEYTCVRAAFSHIKEESNVKPDYSTN